MLSKPALHGLATATPPGSRRQALSENPEKREFSQGSQLLGGLFPGAEPGVSLSPYPTSPSPSSVKASSVAEGLQVTGDENLLLHYTTTP